MVKNDAEMANKPVKDAGCESQQDLTHQEPAAIIASLFVWEAKEKKISRQVVSLQLLIVLIISGVTYSIDDSLQYATAVLSGGLAAVLNGALLAWRMSSAAVQGAHLQLRLMYYYAAERFFVVIVVLGACMAVLKLPPLALIGGFVAGQATMLAARLFLHKLN